MSLPGLTELETLSNEACKRYQNGDTSIINDIYDDISPFCLKVCSKTCGRFITEHDEEASITRIALLEAFDKYNSEKGSFLVYLGMTIRNRIIDYHRREKKKKAIPFSYFADSNGQSREPVDRESIEDIIDSLARKQEIDRFIKILDEYGIQLLDLVKASPRQTRTREKGWEISAIIVRNAELRSYLLEKKKLPVKSLTENWNISYKITERYRKYIIAVALIYIYDFTLLKPYVSPARKVDKNGQ